jgi:hypothetical protein
MLVQSLFGLVEDCGEGRLPPERHVYEARKGLPALIKTVISALLYHSRVGCGQIDFEEK